MSVLIATLVVLLSSKATLAAQQDKRVQAAADMYEAAVARVEAADYLPAARMLMRIVDTGAATRLDEVFFLLGDAFYELELYHSADATYRRHFRSSKNTSAGILALQKCRYHLGDAQQSLKFYNALEASYSDRQDIAESRYYAGQIYYNSKRYNLAFNIFQLISKDSEVYPFALYTSALVHLRRKEMRAALQTLLDVTDLPTKSVAQIEIGDAARLSLAYINFELSRYASTLAVVSQISPAFNEYADALLVEAWSHYQLSDHQATLAVLSKLVADFPEHHTIPEAHFLMGQCYLQIGYYPFALNEFEILLQQIPEPGLISAQTESASRQLATDEQKLAELRVQSRSLQLALVATVDFSGSTDLDLERVRTQRDTLVEKINDTQDLIEATHNRIAQNKRRIETSEVHKNWRAYTEYGRVRSMYLDDIVEN
jgi:tetratricopeptide (TPR) repeat protein